LQGQAEIRAPEEVHHRLEIVFGAAGHADLVTLDTGLHFYFGFFNRLDNLFGFFRYDSLCNFNDLARRTGSIIFSASHAGEMSFESPKIQNGFFTHEILEALASNQADANQDGRISIDELEAFVSLKVALMTGGLQRPTVDRDNINQRFSFPLLH